MIASVNVESDDYESDHFTPIFTRQRKEFYLTLSDKAKQDIQKVCPLLLSITPKRIYPPTWIDI